MPNRSPINITYGTNQDATFTPKGVDSNGISTFRDTSVTKLREQPVLSVLLEEPKPNGRNTVKYLIKLTEPVVVTDSAGNATVEDDLAKLEIITGKVGDVARRKKIRERLLALAASSELSDVADLPENFW
jgi:predicted RNase H-like nuclease (RuvC/YqgF family)